MTVTVVVRFEKANSADGSASSRPAVPFRNVTSSEVVAATDLFAGMRRTVSAVGVTDQCDTSEIAVASESRQSA